MRDRTHEGPACRILDEFTTEALVIRPGRKLTSTDMLDARADLFIPTGPPAFIRSHDGPECVAGAVRGWIAAVGAKTA